MSATVSVRIPPPPPPVTSPTKFPGYGPSGFRIILVDSQRKCCLIVEVPKCFSIIKLIVWPHNELVIRYSLQWTLWFWRQKPIKRDKGVGLTRFQKLYYSSNIFAGHTWKRNFFSSCYVILRIHTSYAMLSSGIPRNMPRFTYIFRNTRALRRVCIRRKYKWQVLLYPMPKSSENLREFPKTSEALQTRYWGTFIKDLWKFWKSLAVFGNFWKSFGNCSKVFSNFFTIF